MLDTVLPHVRVVIVDDHPVFADALAYRLSAEPDVEVVETARTAQVGMASIDLRRPDVAIIDVALGSDSGIRLAAEIRARSPATKVVIVTAHDDAETALQAVRAGASALVPKDSASEHLVQVVRGVQGGESHFPPALLTDVLDGLLREADEDDQLRAVVGTLSGRELEVLQNILDGLDRTAIAERLYLSVNTVRTHMKNIFAKLEVHSTLEAVSLALQAGMRPNDIDDGRGGQPG